MASLLQPSTTSTSLLHSSGFISKEPLFPSQIPLRRGTWRCNVAEPLKSDNRKPIIPLLTAELSFPNFLASTSAPTTIHFQDRGCDVYLVQPTCPPANENLMELLIMIDACRRASAKNITAVIPYFGYAKADRKTQGRESIANLITEADADRVLACDLHSGQSMGYIDIPVDHGHGQPVILDYLANKSICSHDLVAVSPDVGGVARAYAFAKKLSVEL